jgi:hypothetical protein
MMMINDTDRVELSTAFVSVVGGLPIIEEVPVKSIRL